MILLQVIIHLPDISDSELQVHAVGQPLGLLPVAGNVVLGHTLHQVLTKAGFVDAEVVVLTPTHASEIAAWLAAAYPTANAKVILQPDATGPLSALWMFRDRLASENVLLLLGQYIAEAPYEELVASDADAACLVQEHATVVVAERVSVTEATLSSDAQNGTLPLAGACWFRRGADLVPALEELTGKGSESVAALLEQLQRRGWQMVALAAYACVRTDSQAALQDANARLLGLGYGSEDAIERSYAEDFTVLPPVFIHEDAVVENAVLGPFVNVEAGAIVRNSIVRNTIVGAGCQVEDVVLDSSLLGQDVRVKGRALTISAGAATRVEWGG